MTFISMFIRQARYRYLDIAHVLGLRSQDPSLEAVWRNANASLPNASQITEGDIKASKSSWPIVLFLGVVFGGPYLIWRLLSSLVPSKVKSHGWVTGQEEHYAAIGQYPFQVIKQCIFASDTLFLQYTVPYHFL